MSEDDRTGAYTPTSTSPLVELFELWARKTALGVRTHTPATVVAPGYDPATQTVTVSVDYLEIERVTNVPGAAASNLTKPRPPLVVPGVPVLINGGGDGIGYLSFPILPGSTGMLAVMDRDIATWINRGAPVPVDPVFSKLHPLGSVVFLPGLADTLHRIPTPTDQAAAVLEHPQIKIGRGAPVPNRAITIVDLAALVDTILGWTVVPNDGGAALKAAVSAWWVAVGAGNLLGSQKTRIE